MRVTTFVQFIWSDRQGRYLLVKKRSINRTDGFVALCKGASAQQTDLANSQQNFYNTLTNDYSQQFANQNAILGTLQNSLNPIIAAGPNQFGFSTGETNALNSQAIQGTGQQYNNAKQALGAQQAAAGGGNSYLPSGAQAAQQGSLAAGAANQASSQLLGIQQAGYNQGYQTYESALGQLGGVAGMYNPNGTANAANQGGNVANSEANEVTQLNNASSPWNYFGGLLGGIGSQVAGGLTGGLGTAVSQMGSGNWGW